MLIKAKHKMSLEQYRAPYRGVSSRSDFVNFYLAITHDMKYIENQIGLDKNYKGLRQKESNNFNMVFIGGDFEPTTDLFSAGKYSHLLGDVEVDKDLTIWNKENLLVEEKKEIEHVSYSWSADGSDRFTLEYPNENLVLKSETVDNSFISNLGVLTTPSPNSFSTGYIPVTTGKITTTQLLQEFLWSRMAFYDKDKKFITRLLSSDGLKVHTYDIDNITRFVRWSPDKTGAIYGEGYKLEKGAKSTIYTTNPQDDYENAYPKYIGKYKSYNKNKSNNRLDYSWSKIEDSIIPLEPKDIKYPFVLSSDGKKDPAFISQIIEVNTGDIIHIRFKIKKIKGNVDSVYIGTDDINGDGPDLININLTNKSSGIYVEKRLYCTQKQALVLKIYLHKVPLKLEPTEIQIEDLSIRYMSEKDISIGSIENSIKPKLLELEDTSLYLKSSKKGD